ncbi:hypothetical protein BJF93_00480 [Xaviernesmea oryzae]|uniref:TNase-like domain-containing protein n=1 Tax=Xaviernesmea oryzae TaxID=464029 RepID=A0A1Q9B0E2_9HYPH|nr:thermonuclease family protein [Xaviernesmea oryzae]OLP61448.1 hypothetical protein BJF93_00480 [Xaviernesmea oryzae]SEL68977.1 Endonuclease YncB, thermonuclease family [Xaviernesmea oryzae]
MRAFSPFDLALTLGLFLLLFLAAAYWGTPVGGQSERVGAVRVVDGDTVAFLKGGARLRLAGIDAPEREQTCARPDDPSWGCGEDARAFLAQRVGTGPLHCAVSGKDRYGRLLGRCTAGGASVNAAMVDAGLAVAYGDYHAEEARARAAQRGIWASRFDRPENWRRRQRAEKDGGTAWGATLDAVFSALGDALSDGLETLMERLFALFDKTGRNAG